MNTQDIAKLEDFMADEVLDDVDQLIDYLMIVGGLTTLLICRVKLKSGIHEQAKN